MPRSWKSTPFKSVVFALAVVLCAAGASASEVLPLLRSNIEVSGEYIRLGDLFDNAETTAATVVFRAPSPGKSGMVSAARLMRIARSHGLYWDNSEGVRTINIARAGIPIDSEEIVTAIEAAIHSEAPLAESEHTYQLEVTSRDEDVFVATGIDPRIEVTRLSFNRRSGRFSAQVALAAGTGTPPVTVTGRAVEVRPVVMFVRPLARGEVVRAEDIEQRQVAIRNLHATAIVDAAAVVGLAARRQLRPGQPLLSRDFERPRIVERGAVLTVTHEAPGLTISVRARALEAGALGDTIRVQNLQSNRIIECIVIAPNLVKTSTTRTPIVISSN